MKKNGAFVTPPDVAGWLWRGLIAVLFVSFGLGKFDGPDGEWVRLFARIGLGQWFRVATGVVEIAGGVLFVHPKTVRVGAVLLGCTMVGAIVAHLTRLGDPIAIIVPGALLVGVVLVGLREPAADLRLLMQRKT